MSTSLTREVCRNYIEELFGPAIFNNEKPNNEVIGLELESFPYLINAQKKIEPVKLYGSKGLMDALIRVSEQKNGLVRYIQNNGELHHEALVAAIEFPDGSSFHFEPGAQVEIATAPCSRIEKVNARLKSMQQILQLVTQQENIHFAQFGTNPWFTAEETGMQMSKTRYRAMCRYFDNINSFGKLMMLQTCSLQVNMDTGNDWTTRVKRIVAANLLAPFATAIFANSPVTAGKVNGYKSYRSFIWQHLDKTRTGILPIEKFSETFNKDELIDAYLNFALKAPVIYIEDFGDEIFPAHFTLEYWLTHPIKNLSPTLMHLKNHLSLLFPEVRLKGYLELRSVDAPPAEWQMIPALFYCGLLYSNQYLNKTLDLLLPFASQLTLLMEKATAGLEADELFNISKKLVHLVIETLADLPESFVSKNDIHEMISFSERFTLQRKTFADDCLQKFNDNKMLFYYKK